MKFATIQGCVSYIQTQAYSFRYLIFMWAVALISLVRLYLITLTKRRKKQIIKLYYNRILLYSHGKPYKYFLLDVSAF
jgi:hypothetical protein